VTDHFDREAATWDSPERVERAAEIARRIMETIPLTRTMDVLDFGSGTGLLGFNLIPRVGSMTFADTSEGMLARVHEKLRAADRAGVHQRGRVHHLHAGALAFPGRYDLIVSLLTLHHVLDTADVMRVLADHLAPGGWLALVDLDTEDGSFHDDPSVDVHHGFDRDHLIALAEGTGLVRGETRTVYSIRKGDGDTAREYPLFLLTARRPPTRSA
jgi:SAM-dependent methyltransferase